MRCLADRIAEMARALYEEYSYDRGAVAKDILGHPLSNVGFLALESKTRGRELIGGKLMTYLKRLVKPYSPIM